MLARAAGAAGAAARGQTRGYARKSTYRIAARLTKDVPDLGLRGEEVRMPPRVWGCGAGRDRRRAGLRGERAVV